ncbi:holo-ACP synthase [Halobacillus sp. Marseille-Q1614]|uniref:holo-ACP synthase n=1 Tax=Halobacillus sp. Marseille-Q1614 TaxID=2709134 RepID=UPI001570A775|nr:holo-ACP synthase [Halobacillus sp. Marseille-Q1614]
MIKGIGVDLIDLERINQSISRNPRMVQRILTDNEQQFFNKLKGQRQIEFFAGRFAAKEAFSKAAGTGIGRLSFHDIEILPDSNGAPQMKVNGYESYNIWIAISHSQHQAIAQVILEEV